jgi:hypothetical protein
MSRPLASFALLAGAALLGGCVEQWAPQVPADAVHLVGASNEGFRRPQCSPMSFDVAVFKSPVTGVERVAGRATTPETRPGWRGEYLDGLWVEGYIDADEMAEFEVRDHPVSTTRVKTYFLWRGTRQADGSIKLREPEPSCGREVVLARN